MKIHILGAASTQFGELWDQSLTDLLQLAINGSIKDAGVEPGEIDAVFVANMAAGLFEQQLHLGPLVSSMFDHQPPAFRLEAACASGGIALIAAQNALLSGSCSTALVVGAEKMTDVNAGRATAILSAAADQSREYGSTFPGLYALFAQAHMNKFGTSRQQLSSVTVKNHRHALDNPQAQFHRELSLDAVSSSALIADPIRLLDCSPISDGASSVILSTKKPNRKVPTIIGRGHAQDSLSLSQRKTLTSIPATTKAAQQALAQAGLSPADIPVAEVHDCFTIAEIMATEDLGFFAEGEGGRAAESNLTTYNGQLVINPSGGLKAAGHPVGATGIKQVAYLSKLLREQKYKYGLTHNVGGTGATAVVHIIKA